MDLSAAAACDVPPEGSLERWAYDFVTSSVLTVKLAPSPIPEHSVQGATALHLRRPGRPSELCVSREKSKTKGPQALRDPRMRACLLHTFLHHELQAGELMCWAVLAFPHTPLEFKRGLLAVCGDEIRHMRMYAEHIERLGFQVGDFPVRDWFWERVPDATSPAAFLAVMGLGFESGNLDHTRRFAERFRAVGDEAGARLQERIAEEEISHVAFAAHWFRRLQGSLTFDQWCAALPAPLSPMVMRGVPLNRADRRRAGLDDPFLDALERWQPVSRGC